jgi:hypothetical protein
MTRAWKITVGAAAGIAAAIVVPIVSNKFSRPGQLKFLTGAVLRHDSDVRKQLPIPNAKIIVDDDLTAGSSTSDSAGFFRLSLNPEVYLGQELKLQLRHPDYKPVDLTWPAGEELHVFRMVPIARETAIKPQRPEVAIADVRVRYAVKAVTTVNVGAAVRTFEAVNTGNIPCNNRPPCSPDGKWKATIASASLDARDGNEFRNARVSCIAGPCPFTKIETDGFSRGGRTINVSVRNWSDTATFLIEAEVTHTMVSDMIRQSYPVQFDRSMNFTLPATAQGPSIEAEMNGAEIVFPLGPSLRLSWATCTLEVVGDHTKLYRCELKPGYRFQE